VPDDTARAVRRTCSRRELATGVCIHNRVSDTYGRRLDGGTILHKKNNAGWLRLVIALATLAPVAALAQSPSLLPRAPDDPRAVVVEATGDGVTDDSAAVQAAIDASYARGGGGIVFLPSGRYRLTRTVFIWPGVRVFGTGPTRPVFVLAADTPGFERGLATMIMFSGSSPGGRGFPPAFPPPDSVPFDPDIADANPATAFPAMSNVDIEIGAGNPAAIGVRFHAAQHAYLSHIDFNVGSGLAGVYMVGNAMRDVRFFGGRYGILTEKPSPAWPFTLVDAVFEGQSEAAIREHEAGLTLDNVSFRDVPVGIEIDRGYGDWLYGRNLRFENVTDAAVVISNEANVYTQVSFTDVAARNVPVFARFRDSGSSLAGAGVSYRVDDFGYGLSVPGPGRVGDYDLVMEMAASDGLPPPPAPVTRELPPMSEWVNVAELGAIGDDMTDNTEVLQQAIARHRVLYFPAGFYHVSNTLLLRPDTVLIGLHSSLTQIILPDDTAGFAGIGAPKALIEAPAGGDNIVSGLGLYGSESNPRVSVLLWRAGENSLVDDVMLQGGHGTYNFAGTRIGNYNADRSGPPDPARRWGSQYPSIWVTDGGGGTFFNIWSANPFASSGLRVTDTTTPGRVYQISAEHHVRSEIEIFDAANWSLFAPQTEEEGGEGLDTISLDIRNSSNILIANYHGYRVTRSKKPVRAAVRLENVDDIRFRNVHVNSESGLGTRTGDGPTTFLRLSKFPYSNAIHDVTSGLEVREREFARLDLPGGAAALPPPRGPVPTLIADGFYSISGAAVDAAGKLYFVDRYYQRIHAWSADEGLTIVRNDTTDPVNLAIDASGHVIVLSSLGREGTVYRFDPDGPATGLAVLERQPLLPPAGNEISAAALLLPGNWWVNGEFRDQIDPQTYEFTTLAELFAAYVAKPKAEGYVSPDGSLILPAHEVFAQGADHRGLRFSDTLDAYSVVQGTPGERVYLANNSENVTYTGLLNADGSITGLAAFANRGGESVAVGPDGRVYVANGQVFVYNADGSAAGRIDVPERPLQVIFGGDDGTTLFVLTHHSLYSAEP